LERGRRVRETLKQNERDLLPPAEQIAVLYAATNGLLDAVPAEGVAEVELEIRARVRLELPDLAQRIDTGEALDEPAQARLRALIERAIEARSGGGKGGS